MPFDSQTEQVIFQPIPIARLRHMHSHHAYSVRPGDVEVHAEMRRAEAVCFGGVG
jgi:hypothetical protein